MKRITYQSTLVGITSVTLDGKLGIASGQDLASWMVGEDSLELWLDAFEGRDVVLTMKTCPGEEPARMVEKTN